MAKFKWDTVHRGNRCGHSWCSDCRKRRGRNRGNRNLRHAIRITLHRVTQLCGTGNQHVPRHRSDDPVDGDVCCCLDLLDRGCCIRAKGPVDG